MYGEPHAQHYSYELLKKAEVRNPNQINWIRSSLYGEWKWRVISEEAILVVVDWMQNWMRSHCFYCMDPGIVTTTSSFYLVGGTLSFPMVWLNVTIVIVTDTLGAFGFMPFFPQQNVFYELVLNVIFYLLLLLWRRWIFVLTCLLWLSIPWVLMVGGCFGWGEKRVICRHKGAFLRQSAAARR